MPIRLDDVPDWSAVGVLHHAAWLEKFAKCPFTAEESTKRWRAQPETHVVIAYDANAPIGFIAWRGDTSDRHITDLYVRPSHRRLGVGRRLLSVARSESARVRLEVAAGNPAQHLYLDLGFVVTGTMVPDRQGRPLLEMVRQTGLP